MTLGLGTEPGPVGQAGSLRRPLQHVAGLAAKTYNTAHRELFSQTDAVHGNAWISAQPSRVAWKREKIIVDNMRLSLVEKKYFSQE